MTDKDLLEMAKTTWHKVLHDDMEDDGPGPVIRIFEALRRVRDT